MGCCRIVDEKSIAIFYRKRNLESTKKITTFNSLVVTIIIMTKPVSAEEGERKMKNKQKTGK